MSLSNAPGGNQVLDFEWNVFEQALDWHNPPPEQSVLSEASVSPEAISYFNPETHAILPPNYPPPASGRPPRGPKKSASSRARRQTQNREAQRAFRIRQRQRFEDLENELHSLRSRYENLQEKYASLHLLYMQRVSFDGSMWGSVSSTGTVGTTVTAGSSENTVGSGRRESDVGPSQPPPKKEKEGSGHVELQLQQADVATWLSAIGQAN